MSQMSNIPLSDFTVFVEVGLLWSRSGSRFKITTSGELLYDQASISSAMQLRTLARLDTGNTEQQFWVSNSRPQDNSQLQWTEALTQTGLDRLQQLSQFSGTDGHCLWYNSQSFTVPSFLSLSQTGPFPSAHTGISLSTAHRFPGLFSLYARPLHSGTLDFIVSCFVLIMERLLAGTTFPIEQCSNWTWIRVHKAPSCGRKRELLARMLPMTMHEQTY